MLNFASFMVYGSTFNHGQYDYFTLQLPTDNVPTNRITTILNVWENIALGTSICVAIAISVALIGIGILIFSNTVLGLGILALGTCSLLFLGSRNMTAHAQSYYWGVQETVEIAEKELPHGPSNLG